MPRSYIIGQTWENTPWGTVEIVSLYPTKDDKIVVEYEMESNPGFVGRYIAWPGCEKCFLFPIQVKHDNCHHVGERGHSSTHCTSSACF